MPQARWMAWLLFSAMLAQAPDPGIQRAIQLTRDKQYAGARRELDGVPAPSDSRALLVYHRLKAAIASGLAEHIEAAREMEQALLLAPADPNLRLATAVAETLGADTQEARGHYLEAAQAYQRAVELAPSVEQYRLNLALELVRHHTFEPAATVLAQAESIFPGSARIRTLLGVSYYAMNRMEESITSLIAALDTDPRFAPAREYLARITFDAPNPAARAVEALCGERDAICAAARLRLNRDDRAAFDDLRRLVKPEDAGTRCELARAYEWRSQWAAARTEMEACVKAAPDNPQHHYRLARIYQRLGLEDLARHEAELQREAARRAVEETERRERAVEAFQYVVKP